MKDEDILPSKKAAKREADRRELEARLSEQRERMTTAMRQTFATPEGKIVLRWLREECGFGKPILGANPATGEIDPMRTTYSAMQQGLYLRIRKFLTPEILREVELYDD